MNVDVPFYAYFPVGFYGLLPFGLPFYGHFLSQTTTPDEFGAGGKPHGMIIPRIAIFCGYICIYVYIYISICVYVCIIYKLSIYHAYIYIYTHIYIHT